MIRAITSIARVIASMRHRSTKTLPLWPVGALSVAFVLSLCSVMPDIASAHGIAGNRFFPTTFTVDDPFISDEFSVLIHHNKQSGDPASKETDINIDYSKRLFPNFGFEFHEAYIHQKFDDGSSIHGWDNLGAGAKWQFLTNDPHELIMSIGTDIDIGGRGTPGFGLIFEDNACALFRKRSWRSARFS